jgi:hypothetical protein
MEKIFRLRVEDEEPPPGRFVPFQRHAHEKIVESPLRLRGAKWRALMRNSASERKAEIFNAPPRESK